MASHTAGISWSESNQAYLVAEFTRLKRLLTGGNGDAGAGVSASAADLAPPPAIEVLAESFGLSGFERDIVLLAAGTEMDSQIAELCPRLTLGVALAVLPEPHWSALSPDRPLREFELIRIEAEQGLTSATVRIDERVLHYLAGLNQPDPRVRSLATPIPYPAAGAVASEHARVAEKALTLLGGRPRAVRLLQLCGDDPDGQEDVAALIALGCGCQPFAVRVAELPPPGPGLDTLAGLWLREAILLPALLMLHADGTGLIPAARQLVERLPGLVIVACRETVHLGAASLCFDVDKPPPAEQRRLWSEALGDPAQALDAGLDVVSEQYRFSTREIHATGTLLAASAEQAGAAELWDTCRMLARPRLEGLAQRLTPQTRWADLVLPEAQMQTLRQIAAQVRHRMKVYETWGFSAQGRRGLGHERAVRRRQRHRQDDGRRGAGSRAGPGPVPHRPVRGRQQVHRRDREESAAGVRRRRGRRRDPAVRRGRRAVRQAQRGEGQPRPLRQHRGRYLLQRMEAYRGLAILTTNMKSALDRAFLRRLRFMVEFPFPDAPSARRSGPRSSRPQPPPRGSSRAKLAQLNVAGGNIRNIALNAAFLAAEAGEPVGMAICLRPRASRRTSSTARSPTQNGGWA